jgi:hypothetical protein
VESPILCFALAATLAVAGPALQEPVTKIIVVQAFRPAVTGGPEGPHYDESAQKPITDAREAALVSPETIVEIDTSKLEGDPGLLAWAPDAGGSHPHLRKRDGGPLSLLDDKGRKQTLAGARNASFPAWSDDGKRVAWLERKDRRKYDLMTAGISSK